MLEDILQIQCRLDLHQRIIIGVSGGPDSLCLLDVLHRAGYPVIVAHFNHRLRPESKAEAMAVESLVKQLGLTFVLESSNVKGYAKAEGLSLEEAARTLRYQFLFAQARKYHAQAVAVGHTADDQVETVLMHLLRGAGLSGLKGMMYQTILSTFDSEIPLVRPLLGIWRDETEAYCREYHLQPHFDASNADTTYFRNRLRHELIPTLETYSPKIKQTLLRTACALQGDFLALREAVNQVWQSIVIDKGVGWLAFEQSELVKLPIGLQRNLFLHAAEFLMVDTRHVSFDVLERAVSFVKAPSKKQIDFVNRVFLLHENGRVYLTRLDINLPSAHWPQIDGELKLEKLVDFGNGWQLKTEEVSDTKLLEQAAKNKDPFQAWLDDDQFEKNLVIRSRKSGDRFQPFGMGGKSIKLSDFFVNRKLPERARQKWPLVCAGNEIAWIIGYCVAHRFRITDKTSRALHLQVIRMPKD